MSPGVPSEFSSFLQGKTDRRRTGYKALVAMAMMAFVVVVSFAIGLTQESRGVVNQKTSGRQLLQSEAGVDCSQVHNVPGDQECAFINNCPDCTDDNQFLNYAYFVYCDFSSSLNWLATFLLVLWWLFLFIGLAVTADDFFCPSLVVISKVLRISPNIAGVTFLAFGNGAPDVFSAIAALGTNGNPALGLGGLLGAGVFVTTVVAGTISVVKPFLAMQRPFIRDVIFYIIGTWTTFYILWVGEIHMWQAIWYLVFWLIYVCVVGFSGSIYKKQKAAEEAKKAGGEGGIDMSKALFKQITDGSPTEFNLDDPMENDEAVQYSKEGMQKVESELSIYESIKPENGTLEVETGVLGDNNDDDNDNRSEKDGSNSSVGEYPGPIKDFFQAINPINTEEWPDMAIYGKVFEVVKSPMVLVITLTCPVVNYEVEGSNNWCKSLNCLHLLFTPPICSFMIQKGMVMAGPIPVWAICLICGAVFAVICWFTSDFENKPVYHEAFGFFGFLVGIIWIYVIANEVVALLKIFGVVMSIGNAILGLTLLAWGNSIGDWISDTVMARQGFARMGFSACFGGPFFNLSLGFGIPMIIFMAQSGTTVRFLEMTNVEFMLTSFLLLSLLFSLIFLPIMRFKVRRYYGLCLLIIYITFLVCAILAQLNIIMPYWTP